MEINKTIQFFNPYKRLRRKTREVKVGYVGVGADNPIRVQSMTTTPTMDTKATVDQTLRLADVGCEIVRITAPTIREARNLGNIKNELIRQNCLVPLVADIHFKPDAAYEAADFVEKVRINPGNYADGKAFKIREYSDSQYEAELQRIEERFTPLVQKLKKLNRSLRIGTNHGSLSDRIMNRYGDSPEGMVASALEFTEICRKNNFHEIIFSMKSSNPRVMISAYRLLAHKLDELGWDYPFHLGVTEAGDGEDGRLKSAVGIGSLLEDGIGDTIRVSLTEDPEREIPVAQEIARRYSLPRSEESWSGALDPHAAYVKSRFEFNKRDTVVFKAGPLSIGGNSPMRVVSFLMENDLDASKFLALLEGQLKKDNPPEIVFVPIDNKAAADKFNLFFEEISKESNRSSFWPVLTSIDQSKDWNLKGDGLAFYADNYDKAQLEKFISRAASLGVPMNIQSSNITVLFESMRVFGKFTGSISASLFVKRHQSIHGARILIKELRNLPCKAPLFLIADESQFYLDTAIILGAAVCDGFGDAIGVVKSSVDVKNLKDAYNFLQACGARITKTEFVSCPSCGRTLFDLQSTTERIKLKTGHLKGVKIAIMGCIVNGPGEMADADFGYVGGGPGKINLYVGKTCVEKSIPFEIADEKLVELIKSHGKWIEPQK